MRKLHFFLLGLLALTFVSCKDTSGDYATDLLTISQMEEAFDYCLTLSTAYAVDILCPENEMDYAMNYGFYEYENQRYRITLPASAQAIADTLTAHGQAALIDSLVLHINRAAEASGNDITNAFLSALNSLEYVNHQGLLNTTSTDALSRYFKTQCGSQIHQSLQTPIQMKLNEKGVQSEWNNILNQYYVYNPQAVSIDLYGHIVDKIIDGVFTEMGKMEGLIRQDESYQVSDILILVF